ncbi:MAG: hypothetical protein ABI415_00170 [Flavitalea sp.]
MLHEDFFKISSIIKTNQSVIAKFTINDSHKIFEGHFPGRPVVPGVCMMQMLKELLEHVIEKETRLLKAYFMKFLAIINPTENTPIQVELSYTYNEKDEIIVIARLYHDTITFLKFKGLFVA